MVLKRVEKGSFGRSANTEALVSIRKSESIGINAPALKLLSDDTDEVMLYHNEDETDEDGKITEITIVDADDIDADDINPYVLSKSNGSATIGCTSWLKKNDLVPEITTRYKPTIESRETTDGEIDGIMVIDLTDEHSTYGSADDDEDDE
jgi:hypothetical protein